MTRIITIVIVIMSLFVTKGNSQVTKHVTAYNISSIVADPTNFFLANILGGSNITIEVIPPTNALGGYRLRINAGPPGNGTNVLVQTNGVNVGSVGTLNFIGATGAVIGSSIVIGGFSSSGSPGVGTSNISVMVDSVLLVSAMTNLNFITGTNISPIRFTNANGDVSIQFNLNPSLTNGFVGITVTNGLATISYVDLAASNRVAVAVFTPSTLNVTTNSASGVMTYTIGYTNQNGTNWTLYPTNVWNSRQGGSSVLTNLAGNPYTGYTNFLTTNSSQLLGVPLSIKDGAIVTNLENVGTLIVSNPPGSSPKIRLAHTNGQSYTEFTVPNQWLPTNSFILGVTNPQVGQILKILSVSISGGIATIILTNDANTAIASAAGNSGSMQFNEGGSLAGTNENTFDRTNRFIKLLASTVGDEKPSLVVSNSFSGFDTTITPDRIVNIGDVLFIMGPGGGIVELYANLGGGSPWYRPRVNNTMLLGTSDRLWQQINGSNIFARRGYTFYADQLSVFNGSYTFEATNATKITNVMRFSLTNLLAGQILKIHSVQNISGGVISVITNDVDNSGSASTSETMAPLTLSGTNLIADATLAQVFSNNIAGNSSGTGVTNILVTSIANGQTITIVFWATNGVNVVFPQYGNSSYIGGSIISPNTNGFTKVKVQRIDLVTNIFMDTVEFGLESSDAIAYDTNYVSTLIKLYLKNYFYGTNYTEWATSRVQNIIVTNKALVRAGQSTSNANIGGIMWYDTGNYTNCCGIATLTNMNQFIVPAHTLTNNGDSIRWWIAGRTANALATTNNIAVIFGSEAVLDTGLQIRSNCQWTATGTITRTGGTSQRIESTLWWPGAGAASIATNYVIDIVQTNGIDTVLKVQAASRRVSVLTNMVFKVAYEPASF
jgi:hypothetical protein